MTDSELYATLCHPLPPANYRAARRKAVTLRVFSILCALAVICGALWAFNN